MATPKTSYETCFVKYTNSELLFTSIEKRPIYDDYHYDYCWPEAIDSNGAKISWADTRKVVRTSREGTVTTWITRPTFQDVVNGECDVGCCVKFNSDGSIYMNWGERTWYYGPLIDGVYENAYETWDDYESDPCDSCRHLSCQCHYSYR